MSSAATRPPAVAGFFYPGNADELASEVDRYLGGAPDHGLTPKAIIAPHAGYRYSAAVAASAYAGLKRMAGQVRRVVLLGPAHRVPVDGLAVPAVDEFETPLGTVPVDTDGRTAVAHLPHVAVDDLPHQPEHSLEVHLPFLQRLFPAGFSLLPFAVGRVSPHEVADVIERCWGGEETLVVVSSDLSHYHDYDTARRLDAETTRAIEGLRAENLRGDSACGGRPVAALLLVARRRGMRVVTLDVRNSGDTQGAKDRVVGYGSWAFVEGDSEPLDEAEGCQLVDLARETVEAVANGDGQDRPAPEDLGTRLGRHQAAFVTLKQNGLLRGCVGGVEALHPVAVAVMQAARNAASADPRFPPVTPAELALITTSVAVLSPLERLTLTVEAELLALLRPGVDGLVLTEGTSARGVFLPQVWDDLTQPADFLTRLKLKAGLPADHWSPTLTAHRFTVQHFA
ncbi:MAG: AmmeMemoRadiSam system protein B [Actinobacteria bacterium]|nr:AmmeMemoRadiSam system protein B [Actinomycetota bacterium]